MGLLQTRLQLRSVYVTTESKPPGLRRSAIANSVKHRASLHPVLESCSVGWILTDGHPHHTALRPASRGSRQRNTTSKQAACRARRALARSSVRTGAWFISSVFAAELRCGNLRSFSGSCSRAPEAPWPCRKPSPNPAAARSSPRALQC